IKNTRDLTQLFAPGLDTLANIEADGHIDAAQGSSRLTVVIPKFKLNTLRAENVVFNWSAQDDLAQYNLSIPRSFLSKTRIAPIRLQGGLKRNELSFKLTARDSNTVVKGVNLDGVLTTVDSLWQIKFNASDIALFNEQWVMSEDNYVRFGKGFFATQEFEFFNGDQRIRLDSMNNGRGLSLSLTNFDLSFLNRFTTKRNVTFRGKIYDFDVTVDEIFQLKGIQTYITTDTLFINEVPYGEITGNLEMADKSSPLAWTLFLNRDRQQVMRVVGGWLPGGDKPIKIDALNLTIPPGEFKTSVKAYDFPLVVLQTFVPGISKIDGEFNGNVLLSGPFNAIDMDGGAVIKRGQFQLDYLKTMCHIRNQKIDLSKGRIYADGDTIYDASQRHMAFIRGGLQHHHFKGWRINCSVVSADDNFMILNTSAEDNLLYYGQAIGRFAADFSGTFQQTNIGVVATTGKETRLYVPISSVVDAQDVRFIKFKNKKDTIASTDKIKSFSMSDLKGLNFEMSVTLTDDAEVQLIFDEQAGDIIKGRGEGDIKLVITRDGEFKMYGNYVIRTGEYLFTLLNWVNKPFTVSEGGVVVWSGDPYAAQINLDATYVENTSLYNFVRDEVELLKNTQPELVTEASKATQVIVTMHLKGDLMKPSISFDLEFPNLPLQLKTIAENKLRLLRQDQNELNRQVFGLVVVGSFLPSSSSGDFIYITSAFNTLTQVLSNQFSNYLTGLATEWFGGKVSSIDFDVAYNEYQNSLQEAGQPNANQTGRELQLRLTTSGLFKNRVSVQFGSQFGLGSPGTSTNDGFLGEDAVVEIQLTENRRWRLKVYQRTEPDIGSGQLRSRYGFGLSFRREYDTFNELMSGLGGWWKKKPS
ncbi:MAG: translocation/assembly module TamB domain-containing protein, partial [Saprospiraceae bacterium]